jgi:hypothetical protein
MFPAADGRTLRIKQTGGHLSVDKVKVETGTSLQWEGPAGTTAEVEFVDQSPFGAIKKVSQGQQLEAVCEGTFRYRCSLLKDGKVVATGSPDHGNWGGEVEVSGKGGGRTP